MHNTELESEGAHGAQSRIVGAMPFIARFSVAEMPCIAQFSVGAHCMRPIFAGRMQCAHTVAGYTPVRLAGGASV